MFEDVTDVRDLSNPATFWGIDTAPGLADGR